MNFYSVIIGTELLNGRRDDAHFSFVNKELLKRGWEQKASFVITDEPPFMEDIFNLIKKDKDSVLFSFGGIGATPDDYTRKVAADIFTDGKMAINQQVKQDIIDRFGDDAYPHRIEMANLPLDAGLLKNVVNNISGFSLENRFFFMPGFPSMSHSMVVEALDEFYPQNNKIKFRLTLKAICSENDLVDTMKLIPSHIELSSLPYIKNHNDRSVIISISSYDKLETKKYFQLFIDFLEKNKIKYLLE